MRKCGGTSTHSNGNGSLMRILPLAFVPHTSLDVCDVSALTHAHGISVLSCRYYLKVAKKLLEGADKREAVKSLDYDCEGEFIRVPMIDRYKREQIKSTGYVLDTLEAALWCLLTTENYNQMKHRGDGLIDFELLENMTKKIGARPLLVNEFAIDVAGKSPEKVLNEAILLIDSAQTQLDYEYEMPPKEQFYTWVWSNGLR